MKQVIFTELAPKAIGPYSQAIKSNEVLYTSGQLGIDPTTGKLADGIEKQTHQAMCNLAEILKVAGASFDCIIKTTIFVTDLSDFSIVNQVYASYFTKDFPARSCVQVAALPLGGLVEIECVATLS